jgi:hypothetical protein
MAACRSFPPTWTMWTPATRLPSGHVLELPAPGHLTAPGSLFRRASPATRGQGVGGRLGAQCGLAATPWPRACGPARELLGRVLAAEPRNALALNTLGHLELAQGDSQKALDAFRAALSARPDYVDSRLAAARILYDRAQFDAAAAEYFRLVTQEKRSTRAGSLAGRGWPGAVRRRPVRLRQARRQIPRCPQPLRHGITLARLAGRAGQQASGRSHFPTRTSPPRQRCWSLMARGRSTWTFSGDGRGLRAQAVPHHRSALP